MKALGLIDDPRVLAPLARSAAQGTYGEKFAALEALGRCPTGALDAIAAALADPDANIVDAAAVALMLSPDRRAIDTLWNTRAHASERVRSRLVSALERSSDVTVVARLRELTHDPSPEVRREARRALSAKTIP